MSGGSPQNIYVLEQEIFILSKEGNNVIRPSKAACAVLSVTPGLNPTWITKSGDLGNISFESNSKLFAKANSIIGSAKRSYTDLFNCDFDKTPLISYFKETRTSSILI